MTIPPRSDRFELEAARTPYFMLGEAKDIKIGDQIHPVAKTGTTQHGGIGADIHLDNGHRLTLRWGSPIYYSDTEPTRPTHVEVGIHGSSSFINPFAGQSFIHPTTGEEVSLDNHDSGVHGWADPHLVNELIRRLKTL